MMSPGPSSMPVEMFLSHSSQDREFVDRIVTVLRTQGVPVWYSQTNILGAQQWHDEIGRALTRCDWFAVLLSLNSLTSLWVKRELNFALQQARYENRILPLVLQPGDYSPLSWTLTSFQNVDFSADFHEGCRDLLRVWGLGYTRPPDV